MGIKQLARVIADHAPSAFKENEIKAYFGRKIAIDASMSIYQFLIAVRQQGQMLTNESGDTTSHLMGTFYRTIRMIENGIKPLYVFDGKPPEMKGEELEKRTERRAEAEEAHAAAVEAGDTEAIDKFSRRLVKVTKEHNEEVQKLLKLMGVPFILAPCEAEAQCAELVRAGVVYASATEDMDCLTFGSNILLRHMTAAEAKKLPIREYHFQKVLDGLEMTREQFVDLCILLGCDYCGSIRGVGPKRAVELIREYKSIEKILEKIDKEKYPVPNPWPFAEARRLFFKPEIAKGEDFSPKWSEPDEEGLVDFLVKEKNFAEDRVRNGVAKLRKSKHTATQGRLDSFFAAGPTKSTTPTSAKRKILEEKNKKAPAKRSKKK